MEGVVGQLGLWITWIVGGWLLAVIACGAVAMLALIVWLTRD